jgi:hypothetical protein
VESEDQGAALVLTLSTCMPRPATQETGACAHFVVAGRHHR